MSKLLLLLLLLLGLGLSLPLHAARISEEDWIPKLDQSFQAAHKKYTANQANLNKPILGANRVPHLRYLRYLIELEDILRQLRGDEATIESQTNIDAFSSSEQRRVRDLRKDALEERILLVIDPPKREASYRDQEKLAKFLAGETKTPLAKIERARKTLGRILSADRVDEDDEKEQDEIIEEAQKALVEIRIACLGSAASLKGFENPFESTAPGAAEALLEEIIEARDLVLADLREKEAGDAAPAENDSQGKKEAVIAGINVQSENLGVLLDNSSSMTSYLASLRKEITGDFPAAHFRECYGCHLNWNLKLVDPNKYSQVLLFMEDLVIVEKVDALYWFSDLHDPTSAIALQRLANLKQRGNTILYALSVDRAPNRDLEPLVDSFSKYKAKK